MIKILNDHVALEPISFEHDLGQAKQTVKGFVGTDKLFKTLVSTKVIFKSKTFNPGDVVYLRADVYNSPQARSILSLDGKDFILIPESFIVAVRE
ncbi:MAG: hypothetical protein NZM26_04660 [Patescibacteria group bacterium]|nr:hypothetical protein [Patescibacteria group bacterium]